MSPPMSQESLKAVFEGNPCPSFDIEEFKKENSKILSNNLFNPKCDQNPLGSDADDLCDCRTAMKGKACNFFLGFCIFSHKFFFKT